MHDFCQRIEIGSNKHAHLSLKFAFNLETIPQYLVCRGHAYNPYPLVRASLRVMAPFK